MTPRPDPSRRGAADSSLVTPSSLVAGIDPAVERVILRCLEHDPARRPQSAYAVYGALPGGDPLAAAVAAGETPSPELVANAGAEGSVRPLYAGIAVAVALAGFVFLSVLYRPHFAALERSPQVLSVKAEEILTQATGRDAPRFSEEGFEYAAVADSTAPRAPMYWRRWSPLAMTSINVHNPGVQLSEPPQTYPGSGTVLLSPLGRLLALRVVPDLSPDTSAAAGVDWAPLVRAAGADPVTATPAAVPDSFLAVADTMAAWRLSGADAPETTFAAAALRGRIVEANTFAGGRPLANLTIRSEESDPEGVIAWFQIILFAFLPIVGGLILARHNLRAGRGDVRGALVVGTSVLVFYVLEYLFTIRASEQGLFRIVTGLTWQLPIGHALIHGATITIAYLAIEPYVRRLWPSVLVSWARLVAGRWRDPIVGRDVLVGAVWGIAAHVLLLQGYQALSRSMGLVSAPYQLHAWILSESTAPRWILGGAANALAVATLWATILFTLLVGLRLVLRRNLPAAIALVLLVGVVTTPFAPKTFALNLAANLLWMTISVFVALRFGFVAVAVSWAVSSMAERFPWTTDFGTWLAPQVTLAWVVIGVILVYGFMTAVGGKSLFRDPLSEPVIAGNRVTGGR
jgi:serine/threonine-protein kinase